MTVREKQMWTDLSWPTAKQIDDYIFTLVGKQYPIVVVAEAYEKLPWRLIDDSISNGWSTSPFAFEERRSFIINECYLRNKQREQQQTGTVSTVAVWTEEMVKAWGLCDKKLTDLPRSVRNFLDKLSQNEIVTASAIGAVPTLPADVHRKIELEFL